MALTADTRIASAAPGGAEPGAAPPDGVIGDTTWSLLLDFDPVRPRWAGRRPKRAGGAMTASRALPPRRPLSVVLPAVEDEVDSGPAP